MENLFAPRSIKSQNCLLKDITYIVFDIETTGGNPSHNGITEIFAYKISNMQIVDEFYSLVNPGRSIPPIVRRITGITNQMVRTAPRISEIFPDFVKFVGDGVFVSHNTIGDLKFLNYFKEQLFGSPFDNFFLCTHLHSEKIFSDSKDKSLGGLCNYLGIKIEGETHRARSDADLTWQLFKKISEALEQRNIRMLFDAIRFQGDMGSLVKIGWEIDKKPQLEQKPGVLKFYDAKNKLIFACGVDNLSKSFHRICDISKLTRKLFKRIVHSKKIENEVKENFLLAAFREVEIFRDNPSSVSPMLWHGRQVLGFAFFKADNNQVAVSVNKFDHKYDKFYAPLFDKKFAFSKLQFLNKNLGWEYKKNKHLLLNKIENDQLVYALSSGEKEGLWEKVLKFFRIPVGSSSAGISLIRKEFAKMQLFDFNQLDGVIFQKQNTGWTCFFIYKLRLLACNEYKAEVTFRDLLKDMKFYQKQEDSKPYEHVSEFLNYNANQTTWLLSIYVKKRRSDKLFFKSIKDMTSRNETLLVGETNEG